MGYEESREKKKKVLIIILVIILFAICATGVVYLVWNWYNSYMANNIYDNLSQQYVSQVEEEVEEDVPELIDNPIDFASLQGVNTDVHAWIQVPGTVIDYPILQNEKDDYYLSRSIYKKYLFAGCIFTNNCNAKDFSDPVTCAYGHNMRNGSMFAALHKFEKKEFFDEHDTFYIYTPGHKLTYKIVSVLKYDNRRITTAYDFTQENDILAYQYSILNPKFEIYNIREDITLDVDSKIVTLSTCYPNQPSYRCLLNGVLISDEPTK